MFNLLIDMSFISDLSTDIASNDSFNIIEFTECKTINKEIIFKSNILLF